MDLEIIILEKLNNDEHNINKNCDVYLVHAKLVNLKDRIEKLIKTIIDTSWCDKIFPEYIKDAFFLRAKKTIEKIANNIFETIDDKITSDAGEYIISMSAQEVLVDKLGHNHLPLSELWNKRKTGNGGFDYHTLTSLELMLFGEAKYMSKGQPFKKAADQADKFIRDGKDIIDYPELKYLGVPDRCFDVAGMGVKAFSIAFSINKEVDDKFFHGVIDYIRDNTKLFNNKEFFIIGIEL